MPLWFLSGHPERNSPPQRRNSLREKNPVRNLPPHPPPSGAPDPIPSGLRPSPLDKGSRPPGGRLSGGHMGPPLRRKGRLSGGPVCRPYGGREDFWAVRTPPLRRKRRLVGASVGHSGVPKWAGFPTPPVGCAPLAHKFLKTGHPGPPGGAGSGWPLKKR